MKHFAVYLPMKDEEKSKEMRPAHLEYLEVKEEEGKVFAKGRFADGSGGLVIYIAESEEEAEEMVKQDPYVSSGARGYEIREWVMTTVETMPK
ncbi:YciI family protein [Oceanobacillus salinisoli]|uniref:YciI family protein n=1 Tax=Oceanobacillus salinisoli TaxID=2678611 RepID=UPI0012E21226|nr:YciI family protein [Oceanobacillus salinisoli]